MTEQRRTPSVVPPAPAGRASRAPTFVPGETRLPGRPRYLSQQVASEFFTALRAGNSIRDSARYAGLNPYTVENWLKRGRGVLPHRPPTPEYVAFARLTDQSRATARVFVVGNLVARTARDTRAAELWLKVHGGDEWREEPDVTPAPSPTTTTYIDARQVTVPAELAEQVVAAMLDKRSAELPPDPVIVTQEPRPHGPSIARDHGLREDG